MLVSSIGMTQSDEQHPDRFQDRLARKIQADPVVIRAIVDNKEIDVAVPGRLG
jgi:hypothetical protein